MSRNGPSTVQEELPAMRAAQTEDTLPLLATARIADTSSTRLREAVLRANKGMQVIALSESATRLEYSLRILEAVLEGLMRDDWPAEQAWRRYLMQIELFTQAYSCLCRTDSVYATGKHLRVDPACLIPALNVLIEDSAVLEAFLRSVSVTLTERLEKYAYDDTSLLYAFLGIRQLADSSAELHRLTLKLLRA